MNPQNQEIDRRSARSTELVVKWNRYLAMRDDRSHRELLRAVDRFIRAESSRMLVSQAHLAEEAAQEALLGVQRKIATMEAPDHPAAYIRKVLINKVSDILRREAKRRVREERYYTPDEVNIDLTPTTDWHDFLGTLRNAISQDEFWTLVLRHHFDFSYDEIGELLEKQPGAVRQIALRGKRKACERMARLEGRVPAWMDLRQIDGGSARRSGATETVDNPRRVSTTSDSGDPEDMGGEVTGLGGATNPRVELPVAEPPPTIGHTLATRLADRLDRLPASVRRWWLRSPSSVIPLIILFAVPAVAHARGPGVLAARVPTSVGAADPINRSAGTATTGRGVEVGALPDQPPAGPVAEPTSDSPARTPARTTTPGSTAPAPERTTPPPPSAANPSEQTDETTTTLPAPTTIVVETNTPPAAPPTLDPIITATPPTLPPLTTLDPTVAPTTAAPTSAAPTVEMTTTTSRPVTTRQATTRPPTTRATTSATTSAPTTARPSTTVAPTTAPPTTAAPTTAAPTTLPSTTTTAAPPITEAPTTAPATTQAPTTAPATTAPDTTTPETTTPATTAPATDAPDTTAPATTALGTTVPSTTVPTTEGPTTSVSVPVI